MTPTSVIKLSNTAARQGGKTSGRENRLMESDNMGAVHLR